MSRDARIENWLTTKQGVQYTYEAFVPFTEVSKDASLRNQARLTSKINEPKVEGYAQLIAEGTDFPPYIGFRTESGKITLADGNHRMLAAEKAGCTGWDMYIVQTEDEYVRQRLTRTANDLNGLGLSNEDLVAQIKFMHRRFQTPVAQLVKGTTVRAHQVVESLAADEAMLGAAAAGFDTTRVQWPAYIWARFNSIALEPVRLQAIKFVQEYKLGHAQVNALVTEINAEHTEVAQRRVLAQWAKREDALAQREKAGPGSDPFRRGTLAKSKLLQALTNTENIASRFETLERLGLTTPSEQRAMQQRWAEVRTKVDKMMQYAEYRAKARA